MDLALEAGSQSPLWQPLTSFAVVAYMRACAQSKVRAGLLTRLQLPAELLETHEMIRSYRNTTVAHSQSQLSMLLPLALLSPDGIVTDVLPITMRYALPKTTASRIAEVIDIVISLLEEQTRPLTATLLARYASASPATVAEWPVPEFAHETADRFSGNSSRVSTPRFTAYWDIDTDVASVDTSSHRDALAAS